MRHRNVRSVVVAAGIGLLFPSGLAQAQDASALVLNSVLRVCKEMNVECSQAKQ